MNTLVYFTITIIYMKIDNDSFSLHLFGNNIVVTLSSEKSVKNYTFFLSRI